MNAKVKNIIENLKNKRVRVFLVKEVEVMGTIVGKEEVFLSFSELSEMELVKLNSAISWGRKEGSVSEFVGGRTLNFEA